MASSDLLILPNQLFKIKYLPKNIKNVFLWEHPHYFKKYKYNRLKLILHRCSIKLYQKYLEKNNYNVKYLEFDKSLSKKKIIMFQIADNLKIPSWLSKVKRIDNPNFLLNNELREAYNKKTDKFFFNNFYMWSKKQLKIIPSIKSKDKYNRKVIPKNELKNIPEQFNLKLSSQEKKILKQSVKYIKNKFPDNPGPEWDTIIANWIYPLTHKHAINNFKYFIKNKVNGYGKYQDYLYFSQNTNKSQTIYHSNISSSLNIGLINPKDIIPLILKVSNINSKEAFIRQLFWREYQLYCYFYCDDLHLSKSQKSGYFKTPSKSLTKMWYSGKVGVYPVDYCIKKAFNTGYLHHIERLMVMGNFMLLWGIKPKDGFKWFMEFSVDSYEWVMYQNVYDMIFYITGGKTMRRPYISSSNYILKMSNLTNKDSKEWSIIWNELYHTFIKKNKGKIGYPYE